MHFAIKMLIQQMVPQALGKLSRACWFLFLVVTMGAHRSPAAEPLIPLSPELPAVRRPAAMALLSDGNQLAITNRATGTLSLIHLEALSATVEFALGKELRGCCALPENRLAVLDASRHELLILSLENIPVVQQRLALPGTPHQVIASRDGKWLIISSLWSHTLTLCRLPQGSTNFEIHRQIQLGYPLGLLALSPEEDFVLVADAFDGELAAVSLPQGEVIGRTRLSGHGIRGLTFWQDRLFISQQILHSDAPTKADEIASGTVIENIHREVLLRRTAQGTMEFQPRSQGELGTPSEGAADPAGIAVAANGERFVALSGVNEVAILNEFGSVRQRPDVGLHPTQVLYDVKRDRIYVLNEFSDSVSVLHVSRQRAIREIPLGAAGIKSPAQRGEELFFSGHLSRFRWMTCHSCHPDGHQVQQKADTFGDDSYGAPKRVLSLLGGRDNNPWAWNGKQRSLHEQIFKSAETTMHGPRISAREVNDLVAYLHTLDFPPASQPVQDDADRQQVERGTRVFEAQQCQRCHVPPLTYTSDGVFDVGIHDEHGQTKFNPPSLRGVSQRRGYFHDLRVQKLEEVFSEEGHQLTGPLSENDLQDLVRFLRNL